MITIRTYVTHDGSSRCVVDWWRPAPGGRDQRQWVIPLSADPDRSPRSALSELAGYLTELAETGEVATGRRW